MGISSNRHYSLPVLLFTVICTIALLIGAGPARGESRQIGSGPLSLSLHGGATNDSPTIGADGRIDLLNPTLNVHLFGTFDVMDASRGLGQVDNHRYGAGLAVSHTYPGKANIFAGTAFINELNEYFAHIYAGGKAKVSETMLLSASYGFGLGPDMAIGKLTKYLTAKSADWGKLGMVYVRPDGFKTNLYYYLTDPGGENISGLEGEVSYPVTDSVRLGVNGRVDLTDKDTLDRDWKTYGFITYAFGSQKGTPIDVALDTNTPVAYPMIVRTTTNRSATASPLTISPASTSAYGCSTDTVAFTASGGTGPYTWSATSDQSSNETANLSSTSGTSVSWYDGSDNFCSSSGTAQITVTDSSVPPQSATGTISVLVGGV